jgi:hypothetical protein
MGKNPILEEIYAAREALLEKYGGDVGAYLQSARERTLASGRAIVNPSLESSPPSPNCAENLPDVFCWTMMGNYSGQTVPMIRQRKEHEFLYGEGDQEHVVWWGIGNNLKSIDQWRKCVAPEEPQVLFTLPKNDKEPPPTKGPICVWQRVVGASEPIPPHVLMLSEPKERYYALICRFDNSLLSDTCRPLNRSEWRTFPKGKVLYNRQTNVLVKRSDDGRPHKEIAYKICMKAAFIDIVQLADPRREPLSRDEWAMIMEASERTLPREEWRKLVCSIREG